MGCVWFVLGILYILSPIDLWPGITDDVICLIILLIAWVRSDGSSSSSSDDEQDE